jgi:N,N'-diacetyllegionaminate synthase
MNTKETYIIAEVGPNHNGSLERALFMIEKLSAIGVDAVKFQISKLENAYSKDAFKPTYQKQHDAEKSPLEMSKKFQLFFEDHLKLSEACSQYKVDYLCTAFEMESLKFLTNNIDMPYYKIPSGEILTVDMLEHIAGQNKPILLSTGMASYDEIGESVQVLNKDGDKDITILHCISNYPTPAEDVNLNVMLEIKSRFNVPIGFSDHTIGNDAAIAAVALGAEVIEKHVTYDKNAEGPDHNASATISEFASLVKSIRKVDKMMGTNEKVFSEDELEIKQSVRKSIVTTQDLAKGHVISDQDICFKRPGFGFKPIDRDKVIGRKIIKEVEADRVILEEHLQ